MMKNIAIILFLLLVSCKSEPKKGMESDNTIDKTVVEMWTNYTKVNSGLKKETLPDSWYFHNNEQDANRLGKLVLEGKKQASSGLYVWYEEANAALPKVGVKHIITDFDGKALAIIEITKVDTIPFNTISKTYAEKDMGTKKEALKKWKKAHWDFFASAMNESDKKMTEEMLVVCEQFKTIWTKQSK
ncbi:ASCH domain-containing protein [uncultured Kordia sp.]|uniref:ASCH domain-containing protein n=1 Tax=uncultured Kordia sp. TaxID=507699 RepID=UPI00262D9E53|nr:ASCH domain-containing protein [uncultured Kordia sp.]